MQLTVNYTSFTPIPETTCIVQNLDERVPVEVSNTETENTGVKVFPGQKYAVRGVQNYARSLWQDYTAVIAVLPFVDNGGGGSGIAVWETNKAYAENQYVTYDTNLYICINAHTSTTFTADAANWKLIGYSGNGIEDWEPNKAYTVGVYVSANGNIYQCSTAHTSSAVFDDDISYWASLTGNINGGDLDP